jgi:hypothetical protein
VLYFDESPEGRFSREHYGLDRDTRTAAERASDAIKARHALRRRGR